MKGRLSKVLNRAKYAAIGAAAGGFVGGLFGRNSASTAAGIGALAGALVGEKRSTVEELTDRIPEREEIEIETPVGDD